MDQFVNAVTLSADDGKVHTVAVDEKFKIQERSNRTTGYSWQVKGWKNAGASDGWEMEDADSPFTIHAHEYLKPENSADSEGRPLCGAGSDEVFVLSVKRPGDHELTLLYRRPWEAPGLAARELKFKIHAN